MIFNTNHFTNIRISLRDDYFLLLKQLASDSGMSVKKYLLHILVQYLDKFNY